MGKRILIADDAVFMRKMLRDVLAKGGYEIAGEAESGEEAFEKYKQLKPDIVTMDVVMGGEGGIKAVLSIVGYDADAKVLMVSAMGQQSLIIDAIQAGAKGFIIKPFNADQVLEEVRRIVG